MKLIIDIPEWKYKSICEGIEASKRCGVVGIDPDVHEAIYNGIPYNQTGDNISREALKEVIEEKATFIDGDSVYKIIDLINNAPTVSDHSVEIAQKSIELGRRVGRLEGAIESQRPQGELLPLLWNKNTKQ